MAAVLLAAAAGCASPDANGEGGASGPALRGGTLVIGMSQDSSTLNPASGNLAEYSFLAYDPLIYRTSSATYEPDLATSWGYVGTGNTEFQLSLRHGVKFSDGSALTAQSVVNSLKYFEKNGGHNVAYAGPVADVTATGPYTVLIKYSSAFPDAVDSLDQDYNAGFIIGPSGLAAPSSLDSGSDGAGAYVLDTAKTVSGSDYVFTRNPDYWNPSAVYYDTIDLKPYASAAAEFAALQTGAIQYAQNMPIRYVANAQADDLDYTTGAGYWIGLFLEDRTRGPLANESVRQALEYGVNRTAVVDALYKGFGTPLNDTGVPGTVGYDAATSATYTYDPTKAKQLLTAAGYPHGFTFKILDVGELDADGVIANAISGQLASIGVTAQVTVDSGSFTQFNADLNSKAYAGLVWQIKGQGEYTESMQNILSAGTGTGNIFGPSDPQVSSLLDQMADAPTTAALDTAARQLTERLDTLAWYIPVAQVDTVELYSPSLHNVPKNFQTIDLDPVGPAAPDSWYQTK